VRIVVLMAMPVATSVPSSIPDLTAEQWREDIRAFVREIVHQHANPFHWTSRQTFEAPVRDLLDRASLGTRLVEVDGHHVTAVHHRLQSLIPQAENDWFVLNQRAFHFSRVEPLIAVAVLNQ
jgi:hypothetical protein